MNTSYVDLKFNNIALTTWQFALCCWQGLQS
jgi:hypothetical protein